MNKHTPYRRHALTLCIISLCVWGQASAWATSSSNPDVLLPELKMQGTSWQMRSQVRFRYWGVHAYDMALWTQPAFNAAGWATQPVALSIVYARAIDIDDLIERTFKEMDRQAKPTAAQTSNWQQTFKEAWRDIKPNDRITAVYTPPGGLAFYFNGKATAKVDDETLAPRFMGIWLSSKTSQQGLKQALFKQQTTLEVVHGW